MTRHRRQAKRAQAVLLKLPKAETSDGSVSVAAAIGVNITLR
jgi:hypothetical protein